MRLRVALSDQVRAFQKDALRAGEKALAKATHLVQGDIGGALVDKGLAHVPEELDAPAIRIATVDIHIPHGQIIALGRPGAPLVVAIFEDEMPKGIHAATNAVGKRVAAVGDQLAHVIGVVVVKAVHASPGDYQEHGIRSLWTVGGLYIGRRRPGASVIGAAQGDDMLAAGPLAPCAGGENAEPGSIVRAHDIRLVAVGLGGYLITARNVAPVNDGTHFSTAFPGLRSRTRAYGARCGLFPRV